MLLASIIGINNDVRIGFQLAAASGAIVLSVSDNTTTPSPRYSRSLCPPFGHRGPSRASSISKPANRFECECPISVRSGSWTSATCSSLLVPALPDKVLFRLTRSTVSFASVARFARVSSDRIRFLDSVRANAKASQSNNLLKPALLWSPYV